MHILILYESPAAKSGAAPISPFQGDQPAKPKLLICPTRKTSAHLEAGGKRERGEGGHADGAQHHQRVGPPVLGAGVPAARRRPDVRGEVEPPAAPHCGRTRPVLCRGERTRGVAWSADRCTPPDWRGRWIDRTTRRRFGMQARRASTRHPEKPNHPHHSPIDRSIEDGARQWVRGGRFHHVTRTRVIHASSTSIFSSSLPGSRSSRGRSEIRAVKNGRVAEEEKDTKAK